MNKSLVSVFVALLFFSVTAGLSFADNSPVLVEDGTITVSCCVVPCCPASCDPAPRLSRFARFLPQRDVVHEVACVKAVCKKGPLGRYRTVYELCECSQDGCCCDAYTGRVKVVRVGYRLVKAKICNGDCGVAIEVESL